MTQSDLLEAQIKNLTYYNWKHRSHYDKGEFVAARGCTCMVIYLPGLARVPMCQFYLYKNLASSEMLQKCFAAPLTCFHSS